MAFSDISSQSFITELMALSKSIIWKNQYLAIEHEPEGKRIDTETYIAARNEVLTFKDVFQFHESVLREILPSEDMVSEAIYDKKSIPEAYRNFLVEREKEVVIDEWENKNGEENAYYRMLFGLPPIEAGEAAYAYNTAYADIDMTTPIHLLDYTDRLKLEKRGYIDELLSMPKNKNKKYLRYVGKYRIYPYISRQAERFELIHLAESKYTYLRNDFADTYEKCRRLMVRVYYTDAFKNSTNIYEGFIGMCILFMAQQQMYAKYLQADITRNFYDLESLKLVYDAYSVPFFPSIPLKYHEKIVKCINELISYKGSTQVFYDMFDLFDFGQMDVFEYYFVKKRIVDENGNPVFLGPNKEQLSKEEMFKIGFAKVGYKDDKFIEIIKPENFVEYEALTSEDPYWKDDADLRAKIYEEDWNYLHSKYIGVQIMFDLSKLLFESCYYLKLLQDNREPLSHLTTYYINTGTDVPIFDLVIYVYALLCRDCGYAGNIPSNPASIAKVYGYNFKEHNAILKMASESMDTFVKTFKEKLNTYVESNEILNYDEALKYYISKITDGAFTYTGDDFPYGEPGYAPPPVFLRDFTPTYNSVKTVQKYIRETIETLKTDIDETEYEIMQLYDQFVTSDNKVFCVAVVDGYGMATHHKRFMVRKKNGINQDIEEMRKAIIASYTQLLNWVNTLLEARRSLTMDPHILEIIRDMDIDNADNIDRIYKNIEELNEYLTIKIRTSTRVEDYTAFANIRKILMTTSQINEVFTKKNGTIASTFEDLLADINPELYSRMSDEDFNVTTEISYVLQTLMKLCDDATMLEAVNVKNLEKIIKYLFLLLKFLKSAKVDLTKFQIIYVLNSRSLNYIKFLCEIHSTDVVYLHKDDFFTIRESIWWMYISQYLATIVLRLKDKIHLTEMYKVIRDEFVKLTDKVNMNVEYTFKDSYIRWFDFMAGARTVFTTKDPLILMEELSTNVVSSKPITPSKLYLDDKIIKYDDESTAELYPIKSNMNLDTKKNHSSFEYSIPEYMMRLIDKINYHTISDRYISSSLYFNDKLIEVEKINLDSSISS